MRQLRGDLHPALAAGRQRPLSLQRLRPLLQGIHQNLLLMRFFDGCRVGSTHRTFFEHALLDSFHDVLSAAQQRQILHSGLSNSSSLQLHHQPRPLAMRKDVVQGRKRKQATSGRRRRRDQKSRGEPRLLCFEWILLCLWFDL